MSLCGKFDCRFGCAVFSVVGVVPCYLPFGASTGRLGLASSSCVCGPLLLESRIALTKSVTSVMLASPSPFMSAVGLAYLFCRMMSTSRETSMTLSVPSPLMSPFIRVVK